MIELRCKELMSIALQTLGVDIDAKLLYDMIQETKQELDDHLSKQV